MHLGNIALLGVGIWMIGTGLDGVPSAGSIGKIVGGIIVIIAAFV